MQNFFKKTIISFSVATVFCIIFNFVYSYFGHGVVSHAMRWAFIFPLALGVFGYYIFSLKNFFPTRIFYNLYNAGIATLALGWLYQGVIDVAGADTIYSRVYMILGVSLIIFAIFYEIFFAKFSRKKL